ncbi:MAG: PhzF family phenazine biosynthesis protein [Acidobacteriota bacterium]
MKIPVYHVDAFASQLFDGNPAAICPLDSWLPDATLQAIASEHNLSETAFYVRRGTHYELRWFTPAVEVDLCGHATVASAHVIFDVRREVAGNRVTFQSKSGELGVDRTSDKGTVLYVLDFPARPPQPCPDSDDLNRALGAVPRKVLAARDYMCVFANEDEVLALKPDMALLAAIDRFAVIVTAPGKDCDFVSRFFAPSKGVDEDPVTGSAHCTLIPYWAERLGKTRLFARQRSRRGGELWCEHRGERVSIAGRAVKFSEGTIELDV